MYRISKDFTFSASHRLEGLPDAHPCVRLHGHNYTVRLQFVAARLDGRGFVIDYRDLQPFGRYLDERLDHRHLNDALPELPNPTAEHLARHLHRVVGNLLDLPDGTTVTVSVSETPKTWAEYTP